jgi:hypothetical protein
MDEATQRVANIWRFWGPIKGTRHPQASSLSPNQEISFTPLCVGWHLAIQVFPPRIIQKGCMKPPGLDLIWGALAPI